MSYLETLRPILLQAGHLALQLRAEGLHTMQKEDGTPVTNADHAVSEFLTTELLAAFPNTNVISEESEIISTPHALTWTIDPIDGTKKYLAGKPQWCVMVALFDTKPLVSMVYYPEGPVWYWAERGKGTFCEQEGSVKQMHLPKPQSPLRIFHSADAIAVGEKSSYGFMKHARRILWDRIDVYVRGDLGYYDLVPPMLFIQEAGGVCLDLAGKEIVLTSHNAVQQGLIIGHRESVTVVLQKLQHNSQ